MALIHATAVVDSGAELGPGVSVGAFAVVGADVVVGEDTEIGASAHVEGPSRIGSRNRIYPHACIGFDPQDLKFKGERTRLEIGDDNTFREFCTVNRGTRDGGGVTSIQDSNLLMAYTHVGHDSHIGSRTVFANGGTLAGHVEVSDDATIGAYSAVHQFCRVGRHGYIGGFSVITMDALPFARTVGQKPRCYGLNLIGLKRKGFSPATIKELQGAFRVLLRSGHNTSQALAILRRDHCACPETRYLVEFVSSSQRGIIKTVRRGGRGGAPE